MELSELQNLWQQYDSKLAENTRLNKEILKTMLKAKPEKRITRIKLKAIFDLIIPVVIILAILVPRVEFRYEIDFYIGLLLFVPFALVTYYWAIRYHLLVNKIDFAKPVTEIKKDLRRVEIYKIKKTKFGYILSPLAMAGIFLIADIPIFSRSSVLPISLIVIVFAFSLYYTFKYSIFERFRKLSQEISEIEKLEQE
jgi:hypothetical protein